MDITCTCNVSFTYNVIIYIKSFKCFRLLPRTVDEEICFLHVSVCLNEVEIYDQVDSNNGNKN